MIFGLCAVVVVSELLARHTIARQLGTALLVIVLGGVAANVGLLPTGATEAHPVPVYEAVFGVVAPLSIFWLLLTVRLRDVLKAGKTVLLAFGVGAVGTVLGALVGIEVASAVASFGALRGPVAGMFAGTYIGGSVNFNAVALEYDVVRRGGLYAGAVAVDNIITAVWMVACLTVPRLFARGSRASGEDSHDPSRTPEAPSETQDRATVTPFDLAVAAGLGIFCVWLSGVVHDLVAAQDVWSPPSILILTVFALALAQTPWMTRLQSPCVSLAI